MRIRVSGKDIDIGEALQTHVNQALAESTAKYAGRPTDATVTFSRDGHGFACEVFVHLSTGLTAQANGEAVDIYAAFEAARERMAKQLRRHKRRLKDHHKERPTPVDTVPAGSFVLAPFNEDDTDDVDAEPADDEMNGTPAGPTIIAETELRVPSLTVGEAVMQMELAHAPVLVFRNEKGGAINVVYRREDGNIGWIDPRVESGGSPVQG
ncbi:ribosome-associated translation inhibitor RaiA [Rubellimicrobium rubrum]|uniref:Ribosome hibernation promoting factor n=1 Tax=Rubellimicrobium rubrum TaxID=2585369 RepID=A0A5C4MQ50_9RHOB|nr:ribosome-associated translation inhibitor RaiA [Rubellimicrobium rubrum]TNC46430.1 ribosome-associated translation inhibitor RaiA [Rubellimicrobium rubrum]